MGNARSVETVGVAGPPPTTLAGMQFLTARQSLQLLGRLIGLIVTLAAHATSAAEPYRVLLPSEGSQNPVILLVPGCSGFATQHGFNVYEHRARQLQVSGYVVVFVDYLTRRNLTNCSGGRDVSHADIAKDILEAAVWARKRASIMPKIYVMGWSYGGGGVIAALAQMPPGPPILEKAVMFYPDCRRAAAWTTAGVSALMLLGAIDEVALPSLCEALVKKAPADSVRTIVYPGARHAFDVQSLPQRTEFGGAGYNAEADQGSWAAALDFLR